MLRTLSLCALILLSTVLHAQHPVIQSVLDAASIDSMLHFVNELSGEQPVDLGSGPVTITSRHTNNPGNALAQAYLQQKLVQFGYTPEVQTFSATGKNILVTKTGTEFPDEIVIFCAHYDAMPAGILAAPAADDDGSGVAAVLELARLIRDIPFRYTIVFALWDEEEQGKVGSEFYAGVMAANDALIRGVVNMDAIAYDGNGDTKARIHTRPIANSNAIADTVFAVRADYGIELDLLLTNPGATYSDHASFWTEGYGAILVIEEFGADGNPYYHTPNDRVQYFDVPYYEKLAKLSMATLAALAIPAEGAQAIEGPAPGAAFDLYAYPNPSSEDAQAWLRTELPGRYRVVLHDAMGRSVAVLHEGDLGQGKHAFILPLLAEAPGAYVLNVQGPQGLRRSMRLVRTP
ncbi:MAG TPA: M20/M25/M40 family metallo-hydrolase [Flavobacteriales bacterium]|jgi:hypothetical protein|nr:M20/M25/M40 family metallo-hydrolase [Flavobacteriales bacterium]